MPKLRNPRGTRAALNALASGSMIEPGQIYVIMDESRIAVGLTATTYQTYAKESEAGGSSSTKVTKAAVALGTQSANQTAFTYTTVPSTAARGLMSQLIIESSTAGVYDIVVRGAGNDSGSLWLSAVSVQQKIYAMSLPVYVENDAAGQDFFIGVRNRGNVAATFTLNNLRMEKFA